MTATQRLESLDNLLQGIARIGAHLTCEVEEMRTVWAGIKHAGGARDDHAAELLTRLRPHFRALERFAQNCQGQVDQAVADPFGRAGHSGDCDCDHCRTERAATDTVTA